MIPKDVILLLLMTVCIRTAISFETVNVKLVDDQRFTQKRYGRDIIDDLPETMTFTLKVTGIPTTLSLRQNRNIDITQPVYVMRDGRIQPEIVHAKIKYYHDLGNDAAIGVSCLMGINGTCFHQLEGTLSKGGNTFRITPIERRELSNAQLNEEHNHVLREVNNTLDFSNDYIIPDNFTRKKFSKRPRVFGPQTTYKVEVLIVTDYSVYEFWFSRSPGPTDAEKDNQTKTTILLFYAMILNNVDLRYKRIQEEDLAIEILYAGIVIADNRTTSTWTEDLVTVDRKVESDIALQKFTDWRTNHPNLPENDHAMLFTNYDLFRQSSDILGLAYLGTVCSSRATSICEQHLDEWTPTHEIGHSLGASHDGQNNNCSLFSYNMASVTFGLGNGNFSTCSVDYFRQKVAELGEDDSNCLLGEGPTYDPEVLKPYESILRYPGQKFSVHTQCILQYGEGSYLCSQWRGPTVCGGITCRSPGTANVCYGYITPYRGTTCGDGMWCIDGECVEDTNAPSVPESCVHGDYPLKVNGMTCTELIKQNPYGCEGSLAKKYCCSSCDSIRTQVAGCEYGDRNASECDVQSCPEYSEDKRSRLCCTTCRTPETSTTAQPATTTTNQPTASSVQSTTNTTTQDITTPVQPTTTTTPQTKTMTGHPNSTHTTQATFTTVQPTTTTTIQPSTTKVQFTTTYTTQPAPTCTCCAACPTLERNTTPQHTSTTTRQPTTTMLQPKSITTTQPETMTVQPKTTTKQRLKSTSIQPTTTTTTQPTTTTIQPITTTAAQSTPTTAQLTTTTTTQPSTPVQSTAINTKTTTPGETTTNETTPPGTTTPELTTTPGPKECPSEWVPHGGSCYYFQLSKMNVTYYLAEQQCDTKYPGSHLVSIETRDEFNFLKGYLTNKHSSIRNNIAGGFLTSGKRVNGKWKWISTGDEIDFTQLQLENTGTPYLNCLSFQPSRHFNMGNGFCIRYDRQFICEI